MRGEGILPQISIIKPKLNEYGKYFIAYNPILYGQKREKTIRFVNTSTIPCKVIINVMNDKTDSFCLVVDETCKKIVLGWEIEGKSSFN